MKKTLLFLACSLLLCCASAQPLSLRDQAKVINQLLDERLNMLLPELMEKNKIDCWIVISREYNEDPVLKTMLPAEWLAARRRTILVFFYHPATKKLEKLAIARYAVGNSIAASWNMQQFPDQWDALVNLVTNRQPTAIALNTSASFAHADGLDHTEYLELINQLPVAYQTRIVSAEPLAVGWLETRTAHEMDLYPQLVRYTHQIIAAGFSEQAITPGITTTEDLVWWFRQKIRDSGFDTWFHPSVSIQRRDTSGFDHLQSFSSRPDTDIIRPGDLLHVDFGITYLRLQTDIQEHAYVLLPGETAVPADLKMAFAKANRLQDLLTGQFKAGRTGNEILRSTLIAAAAEGIKASVYTHPIGYHGHAAGPTIGLWDQQGGVPGSGDFPLHYRTAYSIELNAASYLPSWKKEIRMMLEQDGYYDENGFRYLDGRQTEIHLVPRPWQAPQ